MSGQCKSFSRCSSSMRCWPCVPLEKCKIFLHWFSIPSRQMMKCHCSSSTTCRAIMVMAALERFAAFRGYCNTDRERLSSYLLFCVCWQGIASHWLCKKGLWSLLFKSVRCNLSTLCCQCLAGVWRCSLSCDWLNFTSERLLAQKGRDVTLLLEVERV